ncbi:cupin domain-containing protein [Mucilaginibacter sp. RS28]|uniref:Cupin domain-containing protein n=1 Tax=Mucilaginibacter straminoryzae TaxID=2932774 RepID=A0A9X2BAZ0_9SPHI|nr:cupin domain-containing protein [Mucilaginibacter straminoryzae]MCJ8209297.1 cupin domain-containing protein [Mucilaginibacter straminoryzae]
MAVRNKIITNPKTGQQIRFIKTAKSTSGELLEMETVYAAKSAEPLPHYHPHQTEDFTVISGELTVRINGRIRKLKEGERMHIPMNQEHALWNSSENKTIVSWIVQPALNTEHLLETITGLAADGKTKASGIPNIWQFALTARHFSEVLRFSKAPAFIQTLVFSLLSPIAYLLGYRPVYKKYLD